MQAGTVVDGIQICLENFTPVTDALPGIDLGRSLHYRHTGKRAGLHLLRARTSGGGVSVP